MRDFILVPRSFPLFLRSPHSLLTLRLRNIRRIIRSPRAILAPSQQTAHFRPRIIMQFIISLLSRLLSRCHRLLDPLNFLSGVSVGLLHEIIV